MKFTIKHLLWKRIVREKELVRDILGRPRVQILGRHIRLTTMVFVSKKPPPMNQVAVKALHKVMDIYSIGNLKVTSTFTLYVPCVRNTQNGNPQTVARTIWT